MYHALLTNRYLTTRVIPFIAVAAVALCVALVIIVVSVMSGFLEMVRSSGRALMGDVVISAPGRGMAQYEALMEELAALPQVAASTPLVDGFGMLRMPYDLTEPVQFVGVAPESYADVTGYASTLLWRRVDEEQARFLPEDSPYRADGSRILGDALALRDSRSDRPGIVLGVHVSLGNKRQADGTYRPEPGGNGPWQWWMPLHDVTLSTFPLDAGLDIEATESVILPVVNEFASGIFLIDDKRVIIPIEVAQRILHLDESEATSAIRRDPQGLPAVIGVDAARATQVLVRAAEGTGPGELRDHVQGAYERFHDGMLMQAAALDGLLLWAQTERASAGERGGGEARRETFDSALARFRAVPTDSAMISSQARQAVEAALTRWTQAANGGDESARRGAVMALALELVEVRDRLPLPPRPGAVAIRTWEQQQADFLGPIENERELMRTLFSIVYLVCAALVLAIFWAIVYEKTRDIGILRSIGASRLGIVWIFLRYGFIIGVLGAIVGLGLGWLIVSRINSIHDAMGHPPIWLVVMVFAAALASAALTVAYGRRGRLLPLVLGAIVVVALLALGAGVMWVRHIGGIVVWDPTVYLFTEIPNQVDLDTAVTTMIGAVVFSLIGAMLPAAKAADTDPVHALRYE